MKKYLMRGQRKLSVIRHGGFVHRRIGYRLLVCLITIGCFLITARSAFADNVTVINSATTEKSAALEASHVLKKSAGRLVSLQVFNSSSSAQYILVMDSATVPANGAVTLLCPPIYIAATTYIMIPFPVPLSASRGISVSNSSTGSFTKTIGSADCVFTGQVQ